MDVPDALPIDVPDAETVSEHEALGDNIDANIWGSTRPTVGGRGEPAEPVDMSKSETDHVYNMNFPKMGIALIINNKDFDPRTGMGTRSGTDVDAAKLYAMLKQRGYDVKLQNNLTVSSMLHETQRVARLDHTDHASLVLCILSHGDEGVVYGKDATLTIDSLTAPFKGDRCPSLIGKPKLFIIQACRGSALDHGVVEADSDSVDALPPGRRIPQEADVLMAFSTVPGYFSWRNSTKGSWFVQALVDVMSRHGDSMEIMQIMTRVNHMVAYEFESCASNPAMSEKKQIPCIMSMLTKSLHFPPKK